MKDTLAIVGNGFDVAHQYATRYSDFVANCNCPAFETFRNLQTKYHIVDDSPQLNWYDFESIINALTLKWFERLIDVEREGNDKERKDVLRDIGRMNRIFDSIAKHLKAYISDVTSTNNGIILPSIEVMVDEETPIISFNYSNIAERYSHSVHYIHGSIKENHIILGYPVRDEPDVIEDEATLFSKDKLRELLRFRRFIASKGITPLSHKGKRLLRNYNRQVQFLFGPKGDTDDDFEKLPRIMQTFLSTSDRFDISALLGCCIEEIRRLLIIGHSLMADYDVIDNILDCASNLQEVIIFTYSGETQKDIQKKKKIFQGRNLNIKICQY
ncbi:MAG TPA: AbiH family protein [Candidatus Limiplasma sp.]|jgi:hypothetical protein|nr:AbiH family protein [Candidatus Limiplasma sp.]